MMQPIKPPPALEWDKRKCKSRECPLDHLLGIRPDTGEVYGEVAGPDVLDLFSTFVRGSQFGQFNSSVAAMEAVNRRYEAETAGPAIAFPLPSGMAMDMRSLAPAIAEAMRLFREATGVGEPAPEAEPGAPIIGNEPPETPHG